MAAQRGRLPRNKFNAMHFIYSLTMGKWHSLAVFSGAPPLSTCLPTGVVPYKRSRCVNINLLARVCFPLPAWLLKPITAPKPNKYKHSSQRVQAAIRAHPGRCRAPVVLACGQGAAQELCLPSHAGGGRRDSLCASQSAGNDRASSFQSCALCFQWQWTFTSPLLKFAFSCNPIK